MILDNIEATFEFDPCTNYLVWRGERSSVLSTQTITQNEAPILLLSPPYLKKVYSWSVLLKYPENGV